MTVERTVQGYRISSVHNGYLVTRHYIGYSIKDAKKLFKIYIGR